ncbi:MAG: ABC-type transport auxiliary lipoprotein family protein [Myxococcota bacterium]
MSLSRLWAVGLTALLLAGCLSPRPPAEPRYFSPRAPAAAAADPPQASAGPQLRLRRVRAASYLRDRMVWRRGVEIGFYELLRWTESPARFAQSWLEDELFERRGFRRSSSPVVATLDASLDAFDELLAPAHEASVALDIVLTDPKLGTLLDRTIEVRRPIASDDPKAIADALGDALAAAAGQVGDAVSAALGARSP